MHPQPNTFARTEVPALPQPQLQQLPELMNRIHRSLRVNTLNCCGVLELANISYFEPKEVVAGTFTYQTVGKSGVVMFTQAYREKGFQSYGDALKDYILSQNLGSVEMVNEFLNRNTSRYIRTFHWNIMPGVAREWFQKNYPELEPFYDGMRPDTYLYPEARFYIPQAWDYYAIRKFPITQIT